MVLSVGALCAPWKVDSASRGGCRIQTD